MKPYLARFFLKYSTLELYFNDMIEFNEYYQNLKNTRELQGYEFIRRPSLKAL